MEPLTNEQKLFILTEAYEKWKGNPTYVCNTISKVLYTHEIHIATNEIGEIIPELTVWLYAMARKYNLCAFDIIQHGLCVSTYTDEGYTQIKQDREQFFIDTIETLTKTIKSCQE